MMNIHETKSHLSSLLRRVIEGEEIIIGKAGKPIAKIIPYETKIRKGGQWKGKVHMSEDFDELSDYLKEAFGMNDETSA